LLIKVKSFACLYGTSSACNVTYDTVTWCNFFAVQPDSSRIPSPTARQQWPRCSQWQWILRTNPACLPSESLAQTKPSWHPDDKESSHPFPNPHGTHKGLPNPVCSAVRPWYAVWLCRSSKDPRWHSTTGGIIAHFNPLFGGKQ